jgi:uncharacterized protein (DUF1800 family)
LPPAVQACDTNLGASAITAPSSLSPAAIALNRFGLGAVATENPITDPRRWLIGQFDHFVPTPEAFAALPDGFAMVESYRLERREMRQASMDRQGGMPPPAPGELKRSLEQVAARKDFAKEALGLYRQAVQARAQSALETPAPFVERMVHFWSNHFCISADNPSLAALAGGFERDAIRPHVLGRYEDMLMAVERHPAMLTYLNQSQSIGPNSPAARVATLRNPVAKRGLNENLAREIMELHTLGVRSGYTQGDVTEFARALTGWSVATNDASGDVGRVNGRGGEFLFRRPFHEPGSRTILGRTYPEGGVEQATAALRDFAHGPAAATHIATKVARHFAGDIPPAALVERLSASFTRGRGDLPTLYADLIASPEPWQAVPVKFKTPWEWAVSALRGLGRGQVGEIQVAGLLNQLGQPVWKPGSPAGWDDVAASWAAPDALMRRVELAQRLAAPLGGIVDARELGPRLFPASLTAATAEQVSRAESPGGALALLLISPDFLRR